MSSSKEINVDKLRTYYEKNKNVNYAEAIEALQLLNPYKNQSKSFTTFSKETLRSYMQNPLAYYKQLRNLSRFLYYRCHPYRRLINYNAQMINLEYRQVIPLTDLSKGTTDMKKRINRK